MTEPAPFSVTQDRSDPLATVVTPVGEIDLATAPELGERLRDAVDRDDAVVVDLSHVTFIDSSGFRVLHETAGTTSTVLVVPPGSPVARALAIAGLGQLVPVVDAVEHAKRHLKSEQPG